MSFKLTGTIKVANKTVQVTEKFSKREFIVTDEDGMYPQDISFQLSQDSCPKLDGFTVGDKIEVSFNLRGREWTSPTGEVKYFNTLDCWKIEAVNQVQQPQKMNEELPTITPLDDNSDLPF
jgi:hypothetical protein